MASRYQAACDCGFTGSYTSQAKATCAMSRHSCTRWQARAERAARGRARAEAIDRTPKPCHHKQADHQHGTSACYTLDRCRCPPCARACADAETWRTRQKAYGRYDKYVDAEPARQHVRQLMAQGMGLKRIVAVSDVSQGLLWKLMYGKRRPDGSRTPSKRILATTEARVLAVTLDLAAGACATQADSDRARWQLRALVAIGYSMSDLGRRLGINNAGNAVNLITQRHRMQQGTITAADRLYADLSMTPAPQDTRWQRTTATRARKHARAHYWPAPLELELAGDTDDALVAGEDLDEVAIWRHLHHDHTPKLTMAERREVIRRWYEEEGRPLNELGRATGWNIHRVRRREAG